MNTSIHLRVEVKNEWRYTATPLNAFMAYTGTILPHGVGRWCISWGFLPLKIYGCETWSVTLREERKLRLLVKGVLRKTSGSNRDEVRGEWRGLNDEKLYKLYSSQNIIRERWAGHAARMGKKNVHRWFWWGNLRERDHLQDSVRWETNIKIGVQQI